MYFDVADHNSDIACLGGVNTPITMGNQLILCTFSHSYHELKVPQTHETHFHMYFDVADHNSDIACLGGVNTPITMGNQLILCTFSHSYHELKVPQTHETHFHMYFDVADHNSDIACLGGVNTPITMGK